MATSSLTASITPSSTLGSASSVSLPEEDRVDLFDTTKLDQGLGFPHQAGPHPVLIDGWDYVLVEIAVGAAFLAVWPVNIETCLLQPKRIMIFLAPGFNMTTICCKGVS